MTLKVPITITEEDNTNRFEFFIYGTDWEDVATQAEKLLKDFEGEEWFVSLIPVSRCSN